MKNVTNGLYNTIVENKKLLESFVREGGPPKLNLDGKKNTCE
jgi:hypothetical protein